MDLKLVARENAILGQDFLTWLWFVSDQREGVYTSKAGETFALNVDGKVSVQGGEGESLETASVSSPRGELAEAKAGLAVGKKVVKALLRLELDQDTWRFTLKADDFGVSGLKTPSVELREQEGDDPDAKTLERIYLVDRCLGFLDEAYAEFLELRLGPGWRDEAENVGKWIRDRQ